MYVFVCVGFVLATTICSMYTRDDDDDDDDNKQNINFVFVAMLNFIVNKCNKIG